MIFICDDVPGSGKTLAACEMIKNSPQEKWIYIVPDCTTLARQRELFGNIEFENASPSMTYKRLLEGKNLVGSPSSLKDIYDVEKAFDEIEKQGYNIVIDEAVNVLDEVSYNDTDLAILSRLGFSRLVIDRFPRLEREFSTTYDGEALKDVLNRFSYSPLYQLPELQKSTYLYWTISPKMLQMAKNVYILSFNHAMQPLFLMLVLEGLTFRYLHLEHDADGKPYMTEGYVPPTFDENPDKYFRIDDRISINRVGETPNAMSPKWFNRTKAPYGQLQRAMQTYYIENGRGIPVTDKLWGAPIEATRRLDAGRFASTRTDPDIRQTEDYSDRHYLAFTFYPYMPINERRLRQKLGWEVDDDAYALDTLIQWLWRTAVRKKEWVHLYLPNRQLRDQLYEWFNKQERRLKKR